MARHGLEADLRTKQQQLERDKSDHQSYIDNRKLDQEDRKLDQKDRELKINEDKIKKEYLAKKAKTS